MQPSRPGSTSTRPAASPLPRPPHHQVNTQTKLLDTAHGRILCIADIRGRLSSLNELARDANAKAIIHTGDFGFFESTSLDRINDRTLRHLTMYSPLIPSAQRTHLLSADHAPADIRASINISLLSEFPLLVSGQIKLHVPVYTVWGACEDVMVIEKFRTGTYSIDNLHVLDEATTRCIDVGGVKLRLLGLGGALVPHKMFDNGDGNATIAGGQGTMWTTALQIGELVDTAQRIFDPSETRLLITHSSSGREGIIAQLALVLKADLTISAGLHFRYATSYNEFSVQPDFEGFRHKLSVGKEGFDKVWENVKSQVDELIDDNQRILLDKAFSVIERVPPAQPGPGPTGSYVGEEPAWKNCWNWNLCDAAYGSLVLDIKEGRVSAELKSQGFNYAYRRSSTPSAVGPTPNTNSFTLPTNNTTSPPTKGSTPIPSDPAALPNASAEARPATSSPAPNSGKETANDKDAAKPNGLSATQSSDKAEKEKAKRKDKKEKKEKERMERDAKDKENSVEDKDEGEALPGQPSKSGKSTPIPDGSPFDSSKQSETELKSPATESTGIRTPTGRKPARHPWTLFMRMIVTVTENELREFFGEAQSGITRINNLPLIPGRTSRIAYVEFGDEEAMKAGLEKHAETLKDTVPEVKQATEREPRPDGGYRGGPGRGRGRGGGYVARGFAAAGLTRGHGQGRKPNGDSPGGQQEGPVAGGT